MSDDPRLAPLPGPHLWRRVLALCLLGIGVVLIASAAQWGPGAVALFDGRGVLPQFATSVPFWPLIPIALGAWLWPRGR